VIYHSVRENVVALRQKQANDEYMSSRKMLLEEYRAEAYSKDQYVRKLRRLEKDYKQSKALLTGPKSPLMKRRRVVSDEEDSDIYDTIPSSDF
jgi:hypothetical protein